MFCTECGSKIDKGIKFCDKCREKTINNMGVENNQKFLYSQQKDNSNTKKKFWFPADLKYIYIIGFILTIAGFTNPIYRTAGIIIIIMSFVYQSGKKRIDGIVLQSTLRYILETLGLVVSVIVFLIQPDLYKSSQEEPFALFTLLIALVAYLNLYLKKYIKKKNVRIIVLLGKAALIYFVLIYLTMLIG